MTIENLPNPNGAGHSPNDSRFLVHPVLGVHDVKGPINTQLC
jgi:hypothetical protein